MISSIQINSESYLTGTSQPSKQASKVKPVCALIH